jgi:hypothetical protein
MPFGILSERNLHIFNLDLAFERQSFSWGYTAGLGIFYYSYKRRSDIRISDFYLNTPIGIKYYSKAFNFSTGINTQWFLFGTNKYSITRPNSPICIFGHYFTLGKDYAISRNFKIELYFQSYLALCIYRWQMVDSSELSLEGFGYFPSVGLRLKFERNIKTKR